MADDIQAVPFITFNFSVEVTKAEIRQLDTSFQNEVKQDTWVKVQFNPETLKVSFANQLATPSARDARATRRRAAVPRSPPCRPWR